MSPGSNDAFNFYHSQVRIRVECSFGMLVHRWAILRSPMPVNIPLRKVTALTHALFKLHNYCTNKNDIKHYEQTKIDSFVSSVDGSMPVEKDSNRNIIPDEIMSGGDHSDDFVRRRIAVNNVPRELMLQVVREKDLKLPEANRK